MVISRVGGQVALRSVAVRSGGMIAIALALAGCAGADALKLPGMGSSAPALNITPKSEPPAREASAADTKAARARLGEAATLAAARSNPSDAEAAVAAAGILRRQGDKSGALALLDQTAATTPNDARLFRDRGLLALELGAISRARDHLQHAVAHGSRDWQTHSALGTALAASGKQKDAQRHFAEALKQAPDHPVVLNNLALSLALDGKRDEAEQMLRRAATSSQKAGDARVAQNLALVSRISSAKSETKPAQVTPATKSSAAPAKDVKKAAAQSPLRTAQMD
jgi:Flp pilus assembly protein TadD